MTSPSRLGRQIEEVVTTLNRLGAPFALIGGLALASHRVIRATQDVDMLTDSSRADEIDEALVKLGYHCLHRSADAGNYLRGDERLDFLYANRPVARQLLSSAPERATPFGPLHVISVEGLIAFKLQGWVNNPRRTQDLEDIRALLRNNRNTVNLKEVREYFRLFDRGPLLDEMLNELQQI
jgi:aminoglycoside-2''-adenylyltransferase